MASDVEAKQLAQANSFADLHFYCSSDEEDNDSDEEDTQIPSKLMHEERQKEIEAWNAKEGNTQRHVLSPYMEKVSLASTKKILVLKSRENSRKNAGTGLRRKIRNGSSS